MPELRSAGASLLGTRVAFAFAASFLISQCRLHITQKRKARAGTTGISSSSFRSELFISVTSGAASSGVGQQAAVRGRSETLSMRNRKA
jgi:hypothetical protein